LGQVKEALVFLDCTNIEVKYWYLSRRGSWDMNPSTSGLTVSQIGVAIAPRQEVRCAVRFPLSLPVVLSTHVEEFAAATVNVSASGVLFATDRRVTTGTTIGFQLRMPGEILGTPRDVLVHCRGRVVRCYPSQSGYHTAATIDEYRFADQ
jgi:PilZ domain-containing protein